jgi:sporulation protein YlmC with PRC-barrel domain
MLILQERLQDVPVMSLQTGAQIAKTNTFIIDPRQLKVVAFYLSGPRLDVNPAVLNVADVREFGSMGLIVDSADVITAPDDLVRLREVLEFNFRLENKQVVTESGKKIGTVTNFALDSTTLYIVKLHVRPGLWQSFNNTELLIDRGQVIQVNDHQVIVKDLREKEDKKPAPVLENPFRRAPIEGTNAHADHE